MSTKIEWVKNQDGTRGRSWNPVTGCTKTSPGCKNCYAERMARRLAGRHGYPEAPHHFDVVLRPGRLDIPLRRRKPTTYFVPSMGDLFHKEVQEKWLWRIFKVMAAADRHTFQILTKRPRRMLEFCQSGWYQGLCYYGLNNIWLGVSVENPDYLWRIEELLKCRAAVRFVSLEPLLSPVDISAYMPHPSRKGLGFDDMPGKGDGVTYPFTGLDWIIVGGESGPGARPMHPDWVREIRDQCQTAGAPFFFKSWGSAKLDVLEAKRWLNAGWNPDERKHGRLLDGRTWDEMPKRVTHD